MDYVEFGLNDSGWAAIQDERDSACYKFAVVIKVIGCNHPNVSNNHCEVQVVSKIGNAELIESLLDKHGLPKLVTEKCSEQAAQIRTALIADGMIQRVEISKAGAQMVPAGYMYKLIKPRPDYIKAANVVDVYSVGDCGAGFSPNFCDFGKYFRQNGFGFFNNPAIMHELATLENIDLRHMTLFYYEIYELECDFFAPQMTDLHWVPTRCMPDFLKIDVSVPDSKMLVGYDALLAANIVDSDCSLLSCSNLAENFAVNEHCLFNTFEEAKAAINTGLFHEKEQYPQRLISVYIVREL